MRSLDDLIANNRRWAAEMLATDPQYFARLVAQQKPRYLWIGCSDSRVPANVIVGLPPGELFVHRNVANVVVHTDFNCLSVLEFSIDVLGVRDIIVCGHYGCGGVRAALGSAQLGLCDNWLRHIRDVHQKHEDLLRSITEADRRLDRLCELNVIEQVANVCHTTLVQSAWKRGQSLSIHGWIYGIQDGLVRDLGTTMSGPDDISSVYHVAVEAR